MDLILSILASSLIFIIFRYFPKWNIDTLQAVIINYFVAFSCGILLFQDKVPSGEILNRSIPIALICGVLFISLFIIMGLSSQNNGVARTSIAVKMSMALSVILVMLFNHASIGLSTILPLILALLGVFLASFTKSSVKDSSNQLWMLGVLFIGSAGLDIVLYFANSRWLPTGIHEGIFAALGFLMAGIIGVGYLIIKRIRGEIHVDLRSWLAGIILGIPNFFSIYLLVKSYNTLPLAPHQILSLANVGVVLTSAVLGISLFKEKFNALKIIGLVFCITALGLIVILS